MNTLILLAILILDVAAKYAIFDMNFKILDLSSMHSIIAITATTTILFIANAIMTSGFSGNIKHLFTVSIIAAIETAFVYEAMTSFDLQQKSNFPILVIGAMLVPSFYKALFINKYKQGV